MTYIRAAAYTQINKYSEAIQDCLRSIKIDPNYSKAYSRLGLVYYAQGNYRDAIDKGFRKGWERTIFISKIYSCNLFYCVFTGHYRIMLTLLLLSTVTKVNGGDPSP